MWLIYGFWVLMVGFTCYFLFCFVYVFNTQFIALSDCISTVPSSARIIESLSKELTEFLSAVSNTDGWSEQDRMCLGRLMKQLQTARD